ncbi:rhodanese-like domain-containing protein [Asticcacaulis sp. SL142]|uniref:rhodanese-like domain-containing protein n=1 Tax=Asticcacaulis sp. SL142 TaxID=2995155 RepID=UPI00226C8624|nr:rhodanese-like domain-containing protein [Asticcacaulis sp. SL142]WAC49348.1 rhodanese-like domain-containing protein [Asticcacaulis sp. SL142]
MAIIDLSAADVKSALDKDEIILVDVREPHELAMGYIDGAVSLPLSAFDPAALPTEDSREMVFYCAAGVRSARVLEYLQHQGFAVKKHLSGGIQDWVGKGYPLKFE